MRERERENKYLFNLFLEISDSTFPAVRFNKQFQGIIIDLHYVTQNARIILCLRNKVRLKKVKFNKD